MFSPAGHASGARGRPRDTLWEQDRAASAVPPAGSLPAAPTRKERDDAAIDQPRRPGCGHHPAGRRVDHRAAEIVEERQQLMKKNGDAWKSIQENAKTGNWAVVAANAEIISKNAARIPSLFPEGSLTDKSKAKPEIWQKWPEFEGTAKKMETEAARLQSTASAGNAEASQDIVKDFGRNACGACHTPFRVPPPRQG